jgi:hypothetical protein
MSQSGGGGISLAVGALSIVCTIIRCHPNVKEVEEILGCASIASVSTCGAGDGEAVTKKGGSWVVDLCCSRVLEVIASEEESNPANSNGRVKTVAAEAIQCLAVLNELCKHYPDVLLGPDNER